MKRHPSPPSKPIALGLLMSVAISFPGWSQVAPKFSFEDGLFNSGLHTTVCVDHNPKLKEPKVFREKLAKFAGLPVNEDEKAIDVADAIFFMAEAREDKNAAQDILHKTLRPASEQARIERLIGVISKNPKRFRSFSSSLRDWAENTTQGRSVHFRYRNGAGSTTDRNEVLAAVINPLNPAIRCKPHQKRASLASIRKTQTDLTKDKLADAEAASASLALNRTTRKDKQTSADEGVETRTLAVEGTLGFRLNPKDPNYKSFLYARYRLNDTKEEILGETDENGDDADDDEKPSPAEQSLTTGALFGWESQYLKSMNLFHNGEASITFDFPNKSEILRGRYTVLPDLGKSGIWIGDGYHQLGKSETLQWAFDIAAIVEANYVLDAGTNAELIKIVSRRSGDEVISETQEADDYYGFGGFAKLRLKLWKNIIGQVRYRYVAMTTSVVPDQHQLHADLSFQFPNSSPFGISASFTDGDDPESLIDVEEYKLNLTFKF